MRNNSSSGGNKNKCPITLNTIVNGHSYKLPTSDAKHQHAFNIWALEEWVSSGRSRITNPMTRQPIDAATVKNIKDVAEAMRKLGHAPRENGTRVALTASQLARVKAEAKKIAGQVEAAPRSTGNRPRRSRGAIDIEARDNLGRTALMRAILEGQDIWRVRRMIDRSGANLEARDNYGNTALLMAVRFGHTNGWRTEVVRLLLDRGAAIEAKNNDGDTALTMAARWAVDFRVRNETDIVRLLLDRGAAIEAKNNDGNTALIGAADSGHADIVSLLLDRGAAVEAKNYQNNTALIKAVKDSTNPYMNYSVGMENWTRILRIVETLLQHGADATAKDRGGQTARDWAVFNCRLSPWRGDTGYDRRCSTIKELLSRAEKRSRLASHPIIERRTSG